MNEESRSMDGMFLLANMRLMTSCVMPGHIHPSSRGWVAVEIMK